MKENKTRYHFVQLVVVIAAAVLILKLAQIQLLDSKFKNQAESAALYQKTTYPSRGLVYDRNGKLLVVNDPIYELKVIYNELSPDMDTVRLCNILGITKDDFVKRIEKDWKNVRFSKSIPFTFLNKISPKDYAYFQEFLYEYPGFYSVLRNVRSYPEKNAAHVLGYLSEISPYTLNKNKDSGYKQGDYVGLSGIEKFYESILKGEKGIKYILRDNRGREVEAFAEGSMDSSAISGVDLISSLDIELQKYGDTLLYNKSGSIVAIEPSTGEILAMVSMPSYDPNLLTINRNRSNAYKELLADVEGKPFLDRSVMAKYPPGSIFKPILALIAMQEGVTYPNRTIYCDGEYVINKKKGFSQGCHDHPTPYDVQTAIQYSCNSYFYQILRDFVEIKGYSHPDIGLELLRKHLENFGVGVKLGVDVSHENSGNFPSADYFDKLYGDVTSGWRSTYILSLGIGQGETELTTLQMANLATIIANRGYFYTPHLVHGFSNPKIKLNQEYTTPNNVHIDSIHFSSVITGMEKVVNAGSGINAYVPGIEICGKTGTSQNPHGKDHSVFIAFAPKDNPKIAIAVYVENAGFGSTMAAPIAGLMIEKYLRGEISKNKKWQEERIIQTAIIGKT